ncbi:hypothetical protein GBK04_29835 [Cytophagaceae bacterium SJW1-29]|uniref:Uncharacterized protein n=1 Tax=Salmonirosea aquatica TaxID=2654236 RepID=A0A7C9BPD2_9BACT|nr:hypothetical protein [Cytophagaceae bacterium SJW1-29]
MVYNNPTPVTGAGAEATDVKEVGHNTLTIEIKYPLSEEAGFRAVLAENAGVINRVIDKMNMFQRKDKKANELRRENLIETDTNVLRTITEIKFPNAGRMLEAALYQLEVEIERRDGRKLTNIVKPTATQNDFNDVLRNRNGKSLPTSSNLVMGQWSLLSFLQQTRHTPIIPSEAKTQQSYDDSKDEGPPRKKGLKL